MGGSGNTQQILNTSVQVLQVLLQWSNTLASPPMGLDDGDDRLGDDNAFAELQNNLATASGDYFTNLFKYTWNGGNSVPLNWDRKGPREAREDFVNVPVDRKDLVQAYINQNIAAQAPDWCRDDVRNDLVGLVSTLLQALPTQGFTKTMFTKTYNNSTGSGAAAVKLDTCLYYTARDIDDDGNNVRYLFLYLVGIYYTTSPWLHGMGPLIPQAIGNRSALEFNNNE